MAAAQSWQQECTSGKTRCSCAAAWAVALFLLSCYFNNFVEADSQRRLSDCKDRSLDNSSWVQAYNAGFIRVKASGAFAAAVAAGFGPDLLSLLNTIADCPAVPETFPFPKPQSGSRLYRILKAGQVKVALQNLGPALASATDAFKNISALVVQEVAKAYRRKVRPKFRVYPTSDSAVQAVVDGKADVTDSFYRQWSLVGEHPKQVQRQAQATPACTIWATSLSITWLKSRNPWATLADLRAAGSAVVVPLYSTVLPFIGEIRAALPNAVLQARPLQNFEVNPADLRTILTEFLAGTTTVLLAAPSDLSTAAPRANITDFPVSQLGSLQTNVILPIGPWLPKA